MLFALFSGKLTNCNPNLQHLDYVSSYFDENNRMTENREKDKFISSTNYIITTYVE